MPRSAGTCRLQSEASVKSLVLLLSGVVAMATGAFVRSCPSEVPSDLLTSWCGRMPALMEGPTLHQHCAGCAIIALGAVLIALSPMFAFRRRVREAAR